MGRRFAGGTPQGPGSGRIRRHQHLACSTTVCRGRTYSRRQGRSFAACQHYKQHRPDNPLTPGSVVNAVAEFKASRANRISIARKRTEQSYFKTLAAHCGSKLIHEVTVKEIEAVVAANTCRPKTTRDFLTLVSSLFTHAAERNFDGDLDEMRISNVVRDGSTGAGNPPGGDEFTSDANTLALYRFNGKLQRRERAQL
jgi:hypothetical protein